MAILQKPAALLPLCWGNLYRHKWSLQFILWDMKESLTLLSCNSWQIIFPDELRQCLSNEPTGGGKREMRGALRYPQIEKMASKSAVCPTALSMARPLSWELPGCPGSRGAAAGTPVSPAVPHSPVTR